MDNGEFVVEPYIEYDFTAGLLEDIEENTSNTTVAVEDFYDTVHDQFEFQQACAAVQIFLLAAILGAICARGLFKW